MKKLFPDLTDVDYQRAFQRAGGPIETHVRPGAPFDQTVKDFCEECNTGWMAALEREVEPILTPLVQDQAANVTADEQETIARWATKTVLAFGPTNLDGVPIVSSNLYRWFGQWKVPLPGSIAWLARYTGTEQWPISFHLHGMVIARADQPMPDPASPTNGFHAVLALGPLVVCVFLADVPEGPVATGGSSDRRVLIWPTCGSSVRWPPPTAMASVAELQAESRQTPDGMAAPFSRS
ncbi:MAG: hypothetical protein ACRDQ2_16210 [Gaiellales bacterium]